MRGLTGMGNRSHSAKAALHTPAATTTVMAGEPTRGRDHTLYLAVSAQETRDLPVHYLDPMLFGGLDQR